MNLLIKAKRTLSRNSHIYNLDCCASPEIESLKAVRKGIFVLPLSSPILSGSGKRPRRKDRETNPKRSDDGSFRDKLGKAHNKKP